MDDFGDVAWEQPIRNFYTRGIWQDVNISYQNGEISIVKDGEFMFSQRIEDIIGIEGGLKFKTVENDILRIDDCLFLELL